MSQATVTLTLHHSTDRDHITVDWHEDVEVPVQTIIDAILDDPEALALVRAAVGREQVAV